MKPTSVQSYPLRGLDSERDSGVSDWSTQLKMTGLNCLLPMKVSVSSRNIANDAACCVSLLNSNHALNDD
jgi:hypothetical protein